MCLLRECVRVWHWLVCVVPCSSTEPALADDGVTHGHQATCLAHWTQGQGAKHQPISGPRKDVWPFQTSHRHLIGIQQLQ